MGNTRTKFWSVSPADWSERAGFVWLLFVVERLWAETAGSPFVFQVRSNAPEISLCPFLRRHGKLTVIQSEHTVFPSLVTPLLLIF